MTNQRRTFSAELKREAAGPVLDIGLVDKTCFVRDHPIERLQTA